MAMRRTPMPTMKKINFLSRSIRFLTFRVNLSWRLPNIKKHYLSIYQFLPRLATNSNLTPEWDILDGDRLPLAPLPPPVGGAGVVHVLDWDGVADQAVPREAPQNRLDRAVIRLLKRMSSSEMSSRLSELANLSLSLSSFIFFAIAWWMKLMLVPLPRHWAVSASLAALSSVQCQCQPPEQPIIVTRPGPCSAAEASTVVMTQMMGTRMRLFPARRVWV